MANYDVKSEISRLKKTLNEHVSNRRFEGAVRVAIEVGNLYSSIDKNEIAYDYYQDAKKYSSKINSPNNHHLHRQFLAYRSSLEELYKFGNEDQIHAGIKEFLEYVNGIEDVSNKQIAYHVVSKIYFDTAEASPEVNQSLVRKAKKYAKASLDYLERYSKEIDAAISKLRKDDDDHEIDDVKRRKAGIYQILSNICEAEDDFESAEMYCNKALEYDRIGKDHEFHYILLHTKRRYVGPQRQLQVSQKMLEVVNKMVSKKDLLMETYFYLGEDLLIQKQISEAEEYFWKVYSNKKSCNKDMKKDAEKKLIYIYKLKKRLNDGDMTKMETESAYDSEDEEEDTEEEDSMENQMILTEIEKFWKERDEIELKKKRIDSLNKNGENDLHLAAKASLQEVKFLIEQCGYAKHINSKDSGGWTPLAEAVNHGHADIVEYLIQKGARVNISSEVELLDNGESCTAGGQTPLMEACTLGLYEIISILIKNGADPCKLNVSNRSAGDYLDDYIIAHSSKIDPHILKKLKDILNWLREQENKAGILNREKKPDLPERKIRKVEQQQEPPDSEERKSRKRKVSSNFARREGSVESVGTCSSKKTNRSASVSKESDISEPSNVPMDSLSLRSRTPFLNTSTTTVKIRNLDCSFSEDAVDVAKKILLHKKYLNTLCLKGSDFDDDDEEELQALIQAICSCSKLEQLDLSQIEDIKSHHVSQILEACLRLKILDLYGTSVKTLNLKKTYVLERLIIAKTPMDFTEEFYDQITQLPFLSFLDVSFTHADMELLLSKVSATQRSLEIKSRQLLY